MSVKNKDNSKTVHNKFVQNFKNSKIAFKIGFIASCIAFLAFVLCLLRIFSLFAVITLGVCILIALLAFAVLMVDALGNGAK